MENLHFINFNKSGSIWNTYMVLWDKHEIKNKISPFLHLNIQYLTGKSLVLKARLLFIQYFFGWIIVCIYEDAKFSWMKDRNSFIHTELMQCYFLRNQTLSWKFTSLSSKLHIFNIVHFKTAILMWINEEAIILTFKKLNSTSFWLQQEP